MIHFARAYIFPAALSLLFLPFSLVVTIAVVLKQQWPFLAFTALLFLALGTNQSQTNSMEKNKHLTVTSSAFTNNGSIPAKYTCEGDNINPPLNISGIPSNTKGLVLIMDDPDAPMGTFDHWIMWNINPSTAIEENKVAGVEGKNGKEKIGYTGPCPPSDTHRYFFKVYAIDQLLALESGADKKAVEKAMKGHVLAQGELIGLYKKQKP